MRQLMYVLIAIFCGGSAFAAESSAAAHFHQNIQPILQQYCYDCHGDGANKGGVTFDQFKSDEDIVTNHTLWFTALKNLRAGLMPPLKKARPNADELQRIENWIKYDDFGIDPKNPDPGRVTVRRLNRVEYRNTIRDLMGVDYNTDEEFPADDTGYGFDDIGDVLTLSPMLFEKYLVAAKVIVSQTVPTTSHVPLERVIPGQSFTDPGTFGPLRLSYYEHAIATKTFKAINPGHYHLLLELTAAEHFVEDAFDSNRCRCTFRLDGQDLLQHEFTREGDKAFHFDFARELKTGDHQLAFEVQPLTPNTAQLRSLNLRIDTVTVRGPLEEKYQVKPKNYANYFPRPVPKSASDRRAYAREILAGFALKAFRHPADNTTLDRLTRLAENYYKQRGQTFEGGIAHAMTAVLAAPQFLFREESIDPNHPVGAQPFVDDYTLATRLSYFLWSSMPDDELFRLASENELRERVPDEVKRMLADPRSDAFIRNFTGQWLEARDIKSTEIEAETVLEQDGKLDPEVARLRARLHELKQKPKEERTEAERREVYSIYSTLASIRPRVQLGDGLRSSMRHEIESYFNYIVHNDRSVLELLDSDYTFLNERLAKVYGITNADVSGDDLVRVILPADSPRGGILTMGGVLVVTSNPTRTSPVKRGVFILDNILGMPPPPPPPNLPLLEDSDHAVGGHQPTLREVLAMHREKPMCASCHNRMDPLGLAFENFNAMGLWRVRERDQPIDASGTLITGESFKNIREFKHILATRHRDEFYRTLAEKMLTYALGRGLEYYDVETVDQIVARLDRENGRFSALLSGVVESAPFQKRRDYDMQPVSAPSSGHVEQRAERN